jgi:hypothetical protein
MHESKHTTRNEQFHYFRNTETGINLQSLNAFLGKNFQKQKDQCYSILHTYHISIHNKQDAFSNDKNCLKGCVHFYYSPW